MLPPSCREIFYKETTTGLRKHLFQVHKIESFGIVQDDRSFDDMRWFILYIS